MKVRELMNRKPWTVGEDDSLRLAQSIMAWSRVRHLPVVARGKLAGILSERDILACRADAGGGEEWESAPVRSAMQTAVYTAHPDESLTDVAARLALRKISALPVVEYGALVGLVTATDVLGAQVRQSLEAIPRSPALVVDAMTRDPVTARPDDSLLDAGARMVNHNVRHLPVVDDQGRVAGILSERELRAAVGDPVRFVAAMESGIGEGLLVCDAMTRTPITVSEDHPISQLASFFADRRIGAVPVVDRAGRLTGILSYVDVLRTLAA